MCVCFASCYFSSFVFLYQSLLFVFCLKLRMPSLIFCFVVFFLIRFVSSFEQSNGNCMIFCLLFYCLKSGKCIIISVCLFSQNLDPFLLLRAILQICLSSRLSFSVVPNWTHKNGFFFISFKFKYGQIVSSKTLNFRVRKQYLFVLVVVVVVVGSTSLVVLDVVALRFSANAARVFVCVVMSACLWLSIVSAFRCPEFNCNK